ncbi:MAG TPA: enoyl-CoA hydratase/isomerase family protein [Amycolatopsis sp.]|nr:enoyl-CoA hydratase/isomerase family protein [Amycolatopsis sp.]
MDYETILVERRDHITTITLNRPDALNAFNDTMCAEFAALWSDIRDDDDVRCVVLRAAGDRAFSTGADSRAGRTYPSNIWNRGDPGDELGPKRNKVWKPVICAIHGMCAGGAFYWVNEADIIICSEDATFFDPHVTYGRTSALEPIGMRYRMPLGEVLRVVLLGLNERMSAERAREIGLVSEIVPGHQLHARAQQLAEIVASKPPTGIQGSIKAIWQSIDIPRAQALDLATNYPIVSKTVQTPETLDTTSRPGWTLR